jgi:hypothetical protein
VQPGAPTQGLLSAGGPFTTTDGELNLSTLNLYRLNVNQPPAATLEPFTGTDSKLPLGAGAALVLTGGLLVLLSRKQRPGARRPRTRSPSPW